MKKRNVSPEIKCMISKNLGRKKKDNKKDKKAQNSKKGQNKENVISWN